MKEFTPGQRVRVIVRESRLFQQAGTVVRLRHSDSIGYVEMDDDVPYELQVYSTDAAKRRWVALYPEQCGPVDRERGERP